ncbi:MFS transporter [Hufsiella ginkgonis]|uniref:MFS transporter n=1 Tax=Hufsiella ginkgonis TaxID=2695274 RepID=A0A7K1XV53_9SPHI|nr:MFS transporter [Hufsiella ginkgonis]MXV14881.1 MFS transporter [Hufsiella ginkgonis]
MSIPSYSLRNSHFVLLCTSSFLFSASFNMLIPELPGYLDSLGGPEYKGLIIALFTLTAGISRPFSGKLTDTIGRVPVMAIGSLVCMVCGILYPVMSGVAGFLFLRLIHGFSTGFKPTATAAYVADIVPQSRWGEAMGIHGLFFSTGLAIGPAIGSGITAYWSINALFYCSSLFALLSILIIWRMKETLPLTQRFRLSLLNIRSGDIFEKRVLPAAIVTLLAYLAYGALLTVIPGWGASLGVKNKGLFYVVFTIASIVIRFLTGKYSDRYGRVLILKISLLIMVMALLVIGLAGSGTVLLAGGAIYGISSGMMSPAVSAWTSDLGDPQYRGKAMATMYIALEAGIGLGALLAGALFTTDVTMIPVILWVVAGGGGAALGYLVVKYPGKTTAQPGL